MIRIAAALLVTTTLAAPAMAADFGIVQTMAPPMEAAPANDWSGFYIGAFGGAAFNPQTPGVLQIDQDLDGDFSEPLVGGLATAFGVAFSGANDGGFTGGLEAGYDMQMDQFVVGGVIDIAYVDYADRQMGFSTTPVAYTELTEVGVLGTVRARAGYLFTDNLLAYVHGGLAVGEARKTFTSPGNPNGTSRGNQGAQVGYQIGAGLEAMVTENISIGAEYAYTNLGSDNFTTRYTNGPFAAVAGASDLRGSDNVLDFHQVKAKISYKF